MNLRNQKTTLGKSVISSIDPTLWNTIPKVIKRTSRYKNLKHTLKKNLKKTLNETGKSSFFAFC